MQNNTVPAPAQLPSYTALRRAFQRTHLPRRARMFILLCFEWAELRNYEALMMRDACLCQAESATLALAGGGK